MAHDVNTQEAFPTTPKAERPVPGRCFRDGNLTFSERTLHKSMNDRLSILKCVVPFAPSQRAIGLRALLILALCVGVFVPGGGLGCRASVDGYASADVQTWHDADGDGEKDPDESPLPWVTVQMAYERSMTDSSGQGTVVVFKPGCAHKCWEDESVAVEVPLGYRATTPTEMDLTGEERPYEFGFQLEEGVRLLSFPNEPDWFRAFFNRGLDLRSFHYSVDDERLAVSFNATSSPDQDALYRDVFDIIRILKKIGGISVKWVEITSIPSNAVAVCKMSTVEEWAGRISSAEIVSTYCQSSQISTAIPTATQIAESTPTHTSQSADLPSVFEGRWCFDSEHASFDMQLEQGDGQISGEFFLLKYCEVEGVRSACRIREGEIAGTMKENQAEITLRIPEYDDEGAALLTMDQGVLFWEVREYPQEYYLPAQFSLNRCDN